MARRIRKLSKKIKSIFAEFPIMGNGGSNLGELISLQSDHREPSTEPSANLVGTG
ncbi:MAG: hypothetical protein K0R67_3511, partial [Paenibacillus sp.]|nr:hypothetical protein [Paenibacillus sp.]